MKLFLLDVVLFGLSLSSRCADTQIDIVRQVCAAAAPRLLSLSLPLSSFLFFLTFFIFFLTFFWLHRQTIISSIQRDSNYERKKTARYSLQLKKTRPHVQRQKMGSPE